MTEIHTLIDREEKIYDQQDKAGERTNATAAHSQRFGAMMAAAQQ